MDYARLIKPKMKKEEVKKLFPKKYFIEEVELPIKPHLGQRFSNLKIHNIIYIYMKDHELFGEPISWLYVCFDKDGAIVGFSYLSEHGSNYRPSSIQDKHHITKMQTSASNEAYCFKDTNLRVNANSKKTSGNNIRFTGNILIYVDLKDQRGTIYCDQAEYNIKKKVLTIQGQNCRIDVDGDKMEFTKYDELTFWVDKGRFNIKKGTPLELPKK